MAPRAALQLSLAILPLLAAGGTGPAAGSVPTAPASGDTLVIGESVVDSLAGNQDADTFFVALEAGDTVDLAVVTLSAAQTDGVPPLPSRRLELLEPDGTPVAENDGYFIDPRASGDTPVIAGYVVATSGVHGIVVAPRHPDDSIEGAYELRTRRSAFVLAGLPLAPVSGPAGASATDTLRIFSAGASGGAWSLEATSAWLAIEPEGGTVAGDTVSVVLTADLSQLDEGRSRRGDALLLAGDGWAAPLGVDLEVWSHEPGVEVLSDGLDEIVRGIARLPGGELAVLHGDGHELVRVDPGSGAATSWADMGMECGGGLHAIPSGTVYAVDRCRGDLLRVDTAGIVGVVASGFDTPQDVTVLPDGTVYVLEWNHGLRRVEEDGTTFLVAPSPGQGLHFAAAAHPGDGGIYFGDVRELYRYDPASGGTTRVATDLPDPVWGMEVGASGRWYLAFQDGMGIYDESFQELDFLGAPSSLAGLTLVDGGVVGATRGCVELCGRYAGLVYRVPVADAPFGPVHEGPLAVRLPHLHALPGDTVRVPLILDLAGTGHAVESFEAALRFDPSVLEWTEVRDAAFAGGVVAGTDSTAAGVLRIRGTDDAASPAPDPMRMAEVSFLVLGSAGQGSHLDLEVESLAAPGPTELTSELALAGGSVLVGDRRWGDPDGNLQVTALDALICLSHSVGLDTGSFDASSCDVVPDAGATFLGSVAALDALAILVHAVGAPLPPVYRVGRAR